MRKFDDNIFVSRKKGFKVNKKKFITSLAIILACVSIAGVSINKVIKKYSKRKIVSNKGDIAYARLKKNESKGSLNTIEQSIPRDKKKKPEVKIKVIKEDEIEKSVGDNVGSQKGQKEASVDKNTQEKDYNYKEIFKNDLFLGDSITESLAFYEFLDESNVIAKLGFTLEKAQDEVGNIVKANPKNIYIMLGMNDILNGLDSQEFKSEYIRLIQSIRKELPNTNIYIQSILPVTSKAQKKKAALNNSHINEFNQVITNVVREENVHYINIISIISDRKDLYEPDGIHVKYDFYKLWLNFLIKNTK